MNPEYKPGEFEVFEDGSVVGAYQVGRGTFNFSVQCLLNDRDWGSTEGFVQWAAEHGYTRLIRTPAGSTLQAVGDKIVGRTEAKPDYEAIEREHLGDIDKQTGIYAPAAKPFTGTLHAPLAALTLLGNASDPLHGSAYLERRKG